MKFRGINLGVRLKLCCCRFRLDSRKNVGFYQPFDVRVGTAPLGPKSEPPGGLGVACGELVAQPSEPE